MTDNRTPHSMRSTGFRVPSTGFGTAPLAVAPGWESAEPIPETQAIQTLEFAYENDIRFFDTAPSYGRGLAEQRTGLLLKQVPRNTVVVATKVGFDIATETIKRDYSRAGVLRSLEGSLQRLNIDNVDIVHVHDPDDHWQEVINDALPTLVTLRNQGVIKAVGAGMNQWQMLLEFARTGEFDCLMIAGRYTLLEQSALPLLTYCQTHNIAILAASIYNSGILATGTVTMRPTYNHAFAHTDVIKRVQRLETICGEFGVSLHTAATRFPLIHPAVKSLIVGLQHPSEVQAYLDALTHSVPPGMWKRLQTEYNINPDSIFPTEG